MHIQILEDILYNREMLWYINGLMQVRLSFGDILSKFLVSSAIINPTQVHDMCETSMTRLLSSDRSLLCLAHLLFQHMFLVMN